MKKHSRGGQVVIVPIVKKEADRDAVSAAVAALEGALKAAGVRVAVDAGTEKTPGWKFNFWEMKVRHGTPAELPHSSSSVTAAAHGTRCCCPVP